MCLYTKTCIDERNRTFQFLFPFPSMKGFCLCIINWALDYSTSVHKVISFIFTVQGSSCNQSSDCTIRGDKKSICDISINQCSCDIGYFISNNLCQRSKFLTFATLLLMSECFNLCLAFLLTFQFFTNTPSPWVDFSIKSAWNDTQTCLTEE